MNFETTIVELTFRKEKIEITLLAKLEDAQTMIQYFESKGYDTKIRTELWQSDGYGTTLENIERKLNKSETLNKNDR